METLETETLDVECLSCGEPRRLARRPEKRLREATCPRCDYAGWAPTADMTERTRRAFRERPVEARRLHLVS
jgi:hypothetical protein